MHACVHVEWRGRHGRSRISPPKTWTISHPKHSPPAHAGDAIQGESWTVKVSSKRDIVYEYNKTCILIGMMSTACMIDIVVLTVKCNKLLSLLISTLTLLSCLCTSTLSL